MTRGLRVTQNAHVKGSMKNAPSEKTVAAVVVGPRLDTAFFVSHAASFPTRALGSPRCDAVELLLFEKDTAIDSLHPIE